MFESIDPETGAWLGPRSLDITHTVCCNPDVALCGADLTDWSWEATERTEDCLTCLEIENRLDRLDLGCSVPWCPNQPWWRRLFRCLRSILTPGNLRFRR